MPQLYHTVSLLAPAVVCLVETWLPHEAAPPRLPGYVPGAISTSPSGYGGALIYVRDHIPAQFRPDLSYSSELTTTCIVTADVQLLHHPATTVSVCYRTPSPRDQSEDWAPIQQIIDRCASSNSPFILLGDLNGRHPNWGDKRSNRFGRYLAPLIDEAHLTVLADSRSAPRNSHYGDLATTGGGCEGDNQSPGEEKYEKQEE